MHFFYLNVIMYCGLPLLSTTPGKVDFLNMQNNENVVVGWAWDGREATVAGLSIQKTDPVSRVAPANSATDFHRSKALPISTAAPVDTA